MKKIVFVILFCVAVLCVTLCAQARLSQSAPTMDTRIVTPVTTRYAVGESLNLHGGSITVAGETVAMTRDMLDASTIPAFDRPGDFTIKGSCKGENFSFTVSVFESIEFQVDETAAKLTPAYDFSSLITVREVDRAGKASAWYPITRKDISKVEMKDGKVYATAKVTVNGITREKTFTFEADMTALSVAELKTATVGQNYTVKGVVVAVATTVTQDEVVIADKETGEMICVYNLTNGGKVTLRTLDIDLEIGDEILIPVMLKKSATKSSDGKETADRGKLIAEYTGCKQVGAAILSKNNAVDFNYSQVQEITTNAQFKTYLAKANRANVVYEIVKLKGSLDFVYYGDSRQIKFCFSDLKPSSLTSFRIDGTSATPVFCDGAVQYTTGKSFSELVFGDPKFFTGSSSDSLANKATREVEIYALYIGGNQWYHQFIPLRAEDVKLLQGN